MKLETELTLVKLSIVGKAPIYVVPQEADGRDVTLRMHLRFPKNVANLMECTWDVDYIGEIHCKFDQVTVNFQYVVAARIETIKPNADAKVQ